MHDESILDSIIKSLHIQVSDCRHGNLPTSQTSSVSYLQIRQLKISTTDYGDKINTIITIFWLLYCKFVLQKTKLQTESLNCTVLGNEIKSQNAYHSFLMQSAKLET